MFLTGSGTVLPLCKLFVCFLIMIKFLSSMLIIETDRVQYIFYCIASTAQNVEERWLTSKW